MMRMTVHEWLVVVLTVLCWGALPTADAGEALSNRDIISLSKAGLGDEVVAAKIAQAQRVDFDLEPADLVALKRAGVSQKVISAMLERTTARAKGSDREARPAIVTGPFGAMGGYGNGAASDSVRLTASDASYDIAPMRGSVSHVSNMFVVFRFMNYPGLRSANVTSDRQPVFLVPTSLASSNPVNRVFIGHLDVDEDDNVRSLKIGSGGPWGHSGTFEPDGEWTREYSSAQEDADTWRLQPRKPLEPGEYGIYLMTGELYEFGVR